MIDRVTKEKKSVVDAFYDFLDSYMDRPEALSASEIARKAEISRMYLHKLRKRQSIPTIDVAENIAQAMGTSLSKILHIPVNQR